MRSFPTPCIVSVLLSLARWWQVRAGRGGAESVAHHRHHSLRHTTARLWINHKPLWAQHAIYHGMLTSSSTLTAVWNANVQVTTLNGTDCFLILQTHCGKTLPAAVVAGGDRSKPVVQICLLLSWIGCWTQFWSLLMDIRQTLYWVRKKCENVFISFNLSI